MAPQRNGWTVCYFQSIIIIVVVVVCRIGGHFSSVTKFFVLFVTSQSKQTDVGTMLIVDEVNDRVSLG